MNIEERIIEAIGARGIAADKLRAKFEGTRQRTRLENAVADMVRDERISVNRGRVRAMKVVA